MGPFLSWSRPRSRRRRQAGDRQSAHRAAQSPHFALLNSTRRVVLKLGESVAGIYRERLSLPSGRFALIEDGLGFSLVPRKPSLERRLGEHVSGLVQPETVDWSFGRKRSLGVS